MLHVCSLFALANIVVVIIVLRIEYMGRVSVFSTTTLMCCCQLTSIFISEKESLCLSLYPFSSIIEHLARKVYFVFQTVCNFVCPCIVAVYF